MERDRANPIGQMRGDDAVTLFRHFVRRMAAESGRAAPRIDPAVETALRGYRFPGNVREAENLAQRALILCDGDPIEAESLRVALPAAGAPRPGAIPAEGPLRDLVEAYERDVIRERLRATGGHVTAAAKSLDLERSHLYKKCKALGIDMREET